MSTTNTNKKVISTIDTKPTTWGLDSNALDDWLERDLKQSDLIQQCSKHNNNSKCSLQNLLSHPIKQEEQEEKADHTTSVPTSALLAPNLIPIIKVYSLLNSIRQNEQLNKEKQHSKKRLYSAPSSSVPPPSPVLSDHGAAQKKRRGNNRPAVDLSVKRQRNTDAARRSRLRKAIKMETLEGRVEVLKTNNEQLRVKVAVLETEVTHATEKEQRNRQRVLELEAQLAVAHKQLVDEYQKL